MIIKTKKVKILIVSNKLKNIIIVVLKIIFVIIRNVVVTNTNREFINSISFRVIKIEKNNEIFFSKMKKQNNFVVTKFVRCVKTKIITKIFLKF